MTTAMAELLALVALDKATLHPPLLWPVDKVVRILIGLVALGTASLPIALFIGRTRRAAINVAKRAATVSESPPTVATGPSSAEPG